MTELPAGSVTFLFTDIEGSTRLLEEVGEAGYQELLDRHRVALRAAFSRHGGVEVDTQGDAFFYVFEDPGAALLAARDGQSALTDGPIAVRMGIHTGEALRGAAGYVGREVHRAARIGAAGHGGQVLVSATTAALARGELTELGEHRLKDFDEPIALFQLGTGEFPPLKTISNTNLPRPASSFIGREREVAELTALVRESRLVTLTGPGGTGKTRLAVASAAELVVEFKAGVFWIGLAALRDPLLVTETIAQTLGANETLAAHIGERNLLLVLDNFEQVVESAPELSALLQSCPNLHVLVTSRELLRIEGEIEYAVTPLADSEAVELFCTRAQLPESESIAELCRRLDNLPLAVELAAARTNVLSPAQISERLSQRLDLLKGGRDADPRQQTLRATIAWSYDLLEREEQRLFRALSVFLGGCTLEAAEQVTDADLDTLQSLVDKSLLRFADARFWMLETIREYARDQLAEAAEEELAWGRFSDHVLALAEEAEPALSGPEQETWLVKLELEHKNLSAALAWLESADVSQGARLAAALRFFWIDHGHLTESRLWLEWAVGHAEGETLTRLLYGLTSTAFRQGDYAAARATGERHAEVAREMDDSTELRRALAQLGHVADAEGAVEEAERLYEQSLEISRSSGDIRGVGAALNGLADIAVRTGEHERASALAEEAISIYRDLGDVVDLAVSLSVAASAALARDRLDGAATHVSEALTIFLRIDDLLGLIACAELLAAISAATGDAREAARLLGSAEATRIAAAAALEPGELELHAATLSKVERALSSAELTSAWGEGAAVPLKDLLRASRSP